MEGIAMETVSAGDRSAGFDEVAVDITAAAAEDNYRQAGERVQCDQSTITWAKYGHLNNPDVKTLVEQVLNELNYNHELTEFQEIFLHVIGSKKDLFAVPNTGAGKTEVTGLAALLLRKVFEEPSGLIVVFIPLSGIMGEMLENQKISTAAVSMTG